MSQHAEEAKKQHSEEQIITALKQSEAGDKTADTCRNRVLAKPDFTSNATIRISTWCRQGRTQIGKLLTGPVQRNLLCERLEG